MLLAERLGLRSRGTLYVVLGSQTLECAVASGDGRSPSWVEGTYRCADLFPAPPPNLPSARASASASASAPMADPAAAVLVSLADAIGRFAAELEGVRAGRLRVTVADNWLSVGSVPWSAASTHLQSAEADARRRLSGDGFHIDPADTVRVDDGAFAEPQLAVAYPQALLAAWSALADRLAVPLVSVSPLSSAAWACASRQLASPIAVAVVGDGFALLVRALGRSGRRPNEVTLRDGLRGSGANVQRAHELWQRSCLRHPQLAVVLRLPTWDVTKDQSAAAQLQAPFAVARTSPADVARISSLSSPLLRLAAAAGGHRVVDAVPARAGHRPWRSAVAASALAAAVLIGLQTERSYRQRQQLAASVDSLASVARPASTPRSQPWSRDERARVQAVNAAVRDLNLPIVKLLDALQPPRDLRVAVLSVETTERPDAPAQAGAVRVVAEARDSSDMARYTAYVADRRPFVAAYLVRHEIDDTAVERPYRFTLEAAWVD